jgi:Limiting CO2-inducible proteins B/C beta carbonyic anhydrases
MTLLSTIVKDFADMLPDVSLEDAVLAVIVATVIALFIRVARKLMDVSKPFHVRTRIPIASFKNRSQLLTLVLLNPPWFV